ncbi:hypothetical protein C8R45DRAFT_1177926 [Mycena sanguinolenta]|nr:hypothetical protein C8R45DRAFT_1177926 [Mycena sanguinolenta]
MSGDSAARTDTRSRKEKKIASGQETASWPPTLKKRRGTTHHDVISQPRIRTRDSTLGCPPRILCCIEDRRAAGTGRDKSSATPAVSCVTVVGSRGKRRAERSIAGGEVGELRIHEVPRKSSACQRNKFRSPYPLGGSQILRRLITVAAKEDTESLIAGNSHR